MITDDGRTYTGRAQIQAWLERATSEYDYTEEYVGQSLDNGVWTITKHLEGNFPGGVVDLRFQFVTTDTSLVSLTIEV